MVKKIEIVKQVRNNFMMGIILVLSLIFTTSVGIYMTFNQQLEINRLKESVNRLIESNTELQKDIVWMQKEQDLMIETGMFPPIKNK